MWLPRWMWSLWSLINGPVTDDEGHVVETLPHSSGEGEDYGGADVQYSLRGEHHATHSYTHLGHDGTRHTMIDTDEDGVPDVVVATTGGEIDHLHVDRDGDGVFDIVIDAADIESGNDDGDEGPDYDSE